MTIVITQPDFFDGEVERIVQLLHRGDVDLIHIRKPSATKEAVEALIKQIPQSLYDRLVCIPLVWVCLSDWNGSGVPMW